jgi:uncharacterized glyoxalase superfamily protein PhnB
VLDAIGIVSEDPSKSVPFYARLGIEMVKAGEHEHYEGRTPSGLRVLLDSAALIRTFEPGWQKPTGSGIALCFLQKSPADVDRLYAELLGAGATSKKAPWNAFWGQRYACVLDPDGNQIDLFATL